jgi:hypothetical protein
MKKNYFGRSGSSIWAQLSYQLKSDEEQPEVTWPEMTSVTRPEMTYFFPVLFSPLLFSSLLFFLHFCFPLLFSRTFFIFFPYFFSVLFFSRIFFIFFFRTFFSRIFFPYYFPVLFSRTFSKVATFEIQRFKISVSCFSSTCRYITVHVPWGICI